MAAFRGTVPVSRGTTLAHSPPWCSSDWVADAPSLSASSVALCKLLQHGINADDKRLQDIRVQGEEICNMEEGVRTRSKSAKSRWRRAGPRAWWET